MTNPNPADRAKRQAIRERTYHICPVCGNDVKGHRSRHYARGKLCTGTPERVVYVPVAEIARDRRPTLGRLRERVEKLRENTDGNMPLGTYVQRVNFNAALDKFLAILSEEENGK